MHKLNVQILGPHSFTSTLNELKIFLKFNPLLDKLSVKPGVILFHVDALQDKKLKDYIDSNTVIKICAGNKKELSGNYDASLELPTTLKEINTLVENAAAKKKFNVNSSIEVKN